MNNKGFDSKNFLANRIQTIKPSGISRFFDLAYQMDNVISLGVGEPDYVTPLNFREASILSLEKGYTAYSPNAALIQLRKEISDYLYNKFNAKYYSGNVEGTSIFHNVRSYNVSICSNRSFKKWSGAS
ncbi:hypothetical protein [Lysinibacillus sp. NPDC047702]|uniref:hypothetical protein n=1 Tax=unclassified Lysinibacillus TaxID=2636778 RepID=UPI003D07B929